MKWSDALEGGAYFTRIPKGIAKMRGGPLRLYIQLLEMMHGKGGEVWWSHKVIAEASGMSERNVRKMMAELKDLGYIATKKATGRSCGVHTVVLVPQEHLDLGTNVPRNKRSGLTGTNDPPKADRNKRSSKGEEKEESKNKNKGDPSCDDVSSPSRPTPTCPHCNESVSYLHSIPGRGGEMGCRQCAEKYRAA